MTEDVASIASLALAAAGMVLMIFTVGALAGWRWASRRVRHEPTWMFVSGHAGWGLFLLSLLLAPVGEAWAYRPWLAAVAIAGSVVAFILQLRARAADRSGSR